MERKKRISHYSIVTVIFLITFVYLIPFLYIINTAFKPWTAIREYPPKIIYKPSIASFIRIFTSRTVYPPDQGPSEEEIAQMTWYERIVYEDTNEEIVRAGDLPQRYINSLIIGSLSTLITVTLGTLTAYGFSPVRLIVRLPGGQGIIRAYAISGCITSVSCKV